MPSASIPGAQLPLDAQLRDESGAPVTLGATFNGKPTLVVLQYLRCQNLCGLVLSGATAAVANAQLTPGKDLNLVAVSIDPRDTPADAAAAQSCTADASPNPAQQ